MVDLIKFLDLFKSWGKTKTDTENSLKAELGKLKYVNGEVYFEKGVITLNSVPTSIYYGTDVTLTGKFSLGEDSTLKVYVNDVFFRDIDTTTNGLFSITFNTLQTGTNVLKVVDEYDETVFATKTVTVKKVTPTITLSTNNNLIETGDSFILSGNLSIGTGRAVKIYHEDTLIGTTTTTENGGFSKTIKNLTIGGTNKFQAKFEATDGYNEVISNTVSVFILGECLQLMGKTITGRFEANSIDNGDHPSFEYEGAIYVNWGVEGVPLEKHTSQNYMLYYKYGKNLNYTIKVYGKITEISRRAFRNKKLKEVVIPSTVTKLRTACFMGASSLNKITLPNSLTSIASESFKKTGLTTINIPSSVTSIGTDILYNCSKLEEIVLNWRTPQTILEYVEGKWNLDATQTHFLIPKNTKNMYIEKGYPSDMLVEKTDY